MILFDMFVYSTFFLLLHFNVLLNYKLKLTILNNKIKNYKESEEKQKKVREVLRKCLISAK